MLPMANFIHYHLKTTKLSPESYEAANRKQRKKSPEKITIKSLSEAEDCCPKFMKTLPII